MVDAFIEDPLREEEQLAAAAEQQEVAFPDIEVLMGRPTISEKQAKVMAAFTTLAETERGNRQFRTDTEFMRTIYQKSLEDIMNDKDSVREKYAHAFKEQVNAIMGTTMSSALEAGDINTVQGLNGLQERREQQSIDVNKYAIEESAANAVGTLGLLDATQREVLRRSFDKGDLREQIQENVKKRIMLSQAIREVYDEAAQDTILEKAIDYGSLFIFNLGIADFRTGTAGEAAREEDDGTFFLNRGRKIWNQRLRLMEELSMEEFKEELPALIEEMRQKSGLIFQNEPRMVAALSNLQGFSEDNILLENAFVGLDIGIAAAPIGIAAVRAGTRSARTLPQMSKILGNYEGMAGAASAKLGNELAQNTNDAVRAATTNLPFNEIITMNDALKEAMPNFTPTPELAGEFVASNRVNTLLEQNQSIMQNLTNLRLPARLTPEETQDAISRTQESARRQYKVNVIEDWVDTIPDGRNVGQVELYIGKQKGGGYASRQGAQRAAKNKNLDDVEIVEKDGFHFIKMTKPLDATNVIRPRPTEETTKVGWVRWLLAGNRNIFPDDFFVNNRLTEIAKTTLVTDVIQPLMQPVQKLNRKSKGTLRDILERGDQANNGRGKWFNANELDAEWNRAAGRSPTEDEIAAYYTMKDINDVEYILRNRAERLRMTQDEGLIMAGIEAPSLTGGLSPSPARHLRTKNELRRFANQSRAYDAEEGRHIKREELTQAFIDKKIDDGYEAILLSRMTRLPNEEDPVRLIFAKQGSFSISELPQFVLGYRGGGHRMYEDKYFIKQVIAKRFEDGGRYVDRVATMATASTAAKAQKHVDEMNEALDAYRNFKRAEDAGADNIDELESIAISKIEGTLFDDIDELDQMVRDNNLSLENDAPIEVVFDRGDPKSLEQILAGNPVQFGDEAGTDAVAGWYDLHGRAFTSRRGARVKNIQGNEATLLDPFEATSRALQNAINHTVSVDFKLTEVQKFVKEVENTVGFANARQLRGQSAMQKFINGELGRPEASDPIVRTQLALKREKLRDILNFETTEARISKNAVRGLAEYVQGLPQGEKLSKFVLDFQNVNIPTALRSFAFDTKLGFFSPAQFMLQTQTAWAIKALDPAEGIRGIMGKSALLRMAAINGKPEMVEWAAKQTALTGMPEADFLEMAEALRRTNAAKVGNELAYIDNFPTQMGAEIMTTVANKYRDTRDAGRMIFFEAERWNRLAAFSLAYKRLKKANPNANMLSDEMLDQLVLRTDDFTMNMTTAGSAMWQRGVLSVPTQFQGYWARLYEAMLPQALGGSKAITGADKLKLALGQIGLYGSHGLPMMPYIADQYFRANGQEMDPAAYTAMSRGFWDWMIFAGTQGEVSSGIAERAGTANAFTDFISDAFDKNLFQFFGGPAVEITGDATKAFFDTGKIFFGMATPSGALVEGRVRELAKNLAVLNDAQRAEWLWRYGISVTSDLDVADRVERMNEFAAMLIPLGFKPTAMSEIYKIKRSTSNFQADVDAALELAKPFIMVYLINKNNPERREQAFKAAQDIGMAAGLDDPRKLRLFNQRLKTLLEQDDAMMNAIQRDLSIQGPTHQTIQQLNRNEKARERRNQLKEEGQ